MPTFLSDPPQALYLVLGAAFVVTGVIAAQYQNRRTLIPFVVAFLLLVGLFVIDRMFESPREESVRRAQAIAAAADARNPDQLVAHLADAIEYRAGDGTAHQFTRDDLKNHTFWNTLRHFNVHVAVWDFSRDEVKEIDDNTVEIGFMAKGEVPDGKQIPLYVRATFKRQSDGQFKLTSFRTFEALDRSRPFAIHGFP
jgi:hypothetical protein